MTRRERMERRLEKRSEWAGKAQARSAVAYEGVRRIGDGIPFGQPVLVGHHSERHHRRDIDRMDRGMRKSVVESKLAEHHGSKAVGLAHQLDRSIFDDDPDAIERLEVKISRLEKAAEKCNAINRAWRRGGRDAIAAEFSEALAVEAEKQCKMFSWLARKGPMDATHDRAEARRCRKRLEDIRARRARVAIAEASGGVKVAGTPGWAVVTFADKPDRSVLVALRAAGYRWGMGSWQGPREKLPACVTELVTEAAERVVFGEPSAAPSACLCSEVDAYECVACETVRTEGEP